MDDSRSSAPPLLPELARHPALCLRWLVAGLRQLQHAQRRIIHLMHKTVIAQVADLLVEESTKSRDEIELSQAAIATLLGASQQTVNEAVGHLRILGAVQTGYRKIQVVDVETRSGWPPASEHDPDRVDM